MIPLDDLVDEFLLGEPRMRGDDPLNIPRYVDTFE